MTQYSDNQDKDRCLKILTSYGVTPQGAPDSLDIMGPDYQGDQCWVLLWTPLRDIPRFYPSWTSIPHNLQPGQWRHHPPLGDRGDGGKVWRDLACQYRTWCRTSTPTMESSCRPKYIACRGHLTSSQNSLTGLASGKIHGRCWAWYARHSTCLAGCQWSYNSKNNYNKWFDLSGNSYLGILQKMF